jgi:hypothetical protein
MEKPNLEPLPISSNDFIVPTPAQNVEKTPTIRRRGTLVEADGSLMRSKNFEGSLVPYPPAEPVKLTKLEEKVVKETSKVRTIESIQD